MNRRSLLAGILAAGFARAAEGLSIPIPIPVRVALPRLWGDGIRGVYRITPSLRRSA